jgi:hypothetical protein
MGYSADSNRLKANEAEALDLKLVYFKTIFQSIQRIQRIFYQWDQGFSALTKFSGGKNNLNKNK